MCIQTFSTCKNKLGLAKTNVKHSNKLKDCVLICAKSVNKKTHVKKSPYCEYSQTSIIQTRETTHIYLIHRKLGRAMQKKIKITMTLHFNWVWLAFPWRKDRRT